VPQGPVYNPSNSEQMVQGIQVDSALQVELNRQKWKWKVYSLIWFLNSFYFFAFSVPSETIGDFVADGRDGVVWGVVLSTGEGVVDETAQVSPDCWCKIVSVDDSRLGFFAWPFESEVMVKEETGTFQSCETKTSTSK